MTTTMTALLHFKVNEPPPIHLLHPFRMLIPYRLRAGGRSPFSPTTTGYVLAILRIARGRRQPLGISERHYGFPGYFMPCQAAVLVNRKGKCA